MPNNIDNIGLRSEEVQEILTAVPNWMIKWGNSLVLVLILMLLAITWFVKYPDVIRTEVMITTTFPPEKLYAKSNGQFEVFLVENGDTVIKNQMIAVIENSAFHKDVFLLKSITDTLSIDHENFIFPIENLPPLILGDITSSFAQFETDYSEYVLNNQLTPYKLESLANKMSLIEAKGRLQTLYAQKELNLKELSFKEKEVERQKGLFDDGVISVKAYEQKQLDYLQAKRAYKSLESSISQIRELIGTAQKNIKGTSIKEVQNNTRLLKKVLQSFYQLKKSIKDWEKLYLIKSSINGKLSFLSYWSENQAVKNGDLLFTILPINNISFIGKIKAPVANSGKIKVGQKVQISLVSYPADEFGQINGDVKSISLIPDEEGNYLIDVQLPQTLVTTYGRTIEFKQEMKGIANIITEDLRLMERFFYQLRNVVK